MDPRHKELEEHYLISFLSNESMKHLIGGIEQCDPDPPDFIFNTIKNKISIELKRVINPNLMQLENVQNKIVDKAVKIFNRKRKESLRVFVEFSPKSLLPTNKFISQLSEELVDYVEDMCDRNTGHSFSISQFRNRPINEVFSHISISNDVSFENWQPFGAYLVDYIDEKWFGEIIAEKESKMKANEYASKYDENWLLLISDFGHKSSAFRFDGLVNDYKASTFDKIYLYFKFKDEVIVIK